MYFRTTSGSTYEHDGNRVRRVTGLHEPTPCQGADGEWSEFASMTVPKVGESVLITWPPTKPAAYTLTSPVVEVDGYTEGAYSGPTTPREENR